MTGRSILRSVALLLCAAAAGAAPGAPQSETELGRFSADPYPSTYTPLPRADTIIVNATVLDGAGRRLDEADVLMRAGKIVGLGRNLDRAGAVVVDGTGRWVTPGIIDVHSHNGTFALPLTSIDNEASDVSELSGSNVADTWVEHGVNVQDPAFFRALAGGVTALHIMPGSRPVFAGRTVVLKPVPASTVTAMKFPGAPQGLKIACGENPKSYGAERGRAPTSRQGEIAFIRAAFNEAADYAHEWEAEAQEGRGPKDRPDRRRPHRRDLKKDTLAGVLAGDIPVHLHCYRADDMAALIGVAREFAFPISTFHHAVEAYKIAPMLRQENVCSAVWSDWWSFKMEAVDGIRENAAFVDAAGACTILHSDSPQVGQRLNLEAAKAAGAGRRAGLSLPPEKIIAWITSNPARALRLDDRIGSLARGKNADVVIWSGDPFSVYTKADQVFIDGALAYDRLSPQRQPVSDFELGRVGAER